MMLAYRIKLTPDDNDTLLVTCPALPGVATFGSNREDAIRQAVDAIEERLAGLIDDGEDIPGDRLGKADHVAVLPVLTTLKVALYKALRQDGLTRAELARRLKWNRESVDRLFRLDHASRVSQIETALAVIGRKINVDVREHEAA